MPTMKTNTDRTQLGDRLADYVRMHFHTNPPMPEGLALVWRDYEEARTGKPIPRPVKKEIVGDGFERYMLEDF